MKFRRQRWSNKDKYFGPFTIAPNESSWSVILDSGNDDYFGCHLRVMAPGFAILVALPQIIRPWKQEYECASRQYGFSIFEGHFSLRYGRQTHDSSTEQSWGCFLPWTQWRFVRQSWYGLNGEHIETVSPPDFNRQCEIRDSAPRASFKFLDFDGEEIEASTFITEREWRFGTGGFKWLSLFRKPYVRRSLEIRFSKEVGPRKRSWKGGTIGHGIDMLPGELHEDAFRRYCIEHGPARTSSRNLRGLVSQHGEEEGLGVKCFLRENKARRYGYEGWALRVKGADKPIQWTACTTREEARELRREKGNLLHDTEVVKIHIRVELAE